MQIGGFLFPRISRHGDLPAVPRLYYHDFGINIDISDRILGAGYPVKTNLFLDEADTRKASH